MLNFDWLAGISMEMAKNIFLILFLLIGILVLFIPKEEIYEGIENPRWYHNLKLWAWGDLLFILTVYLIF